MAREIISGKKGWMMKNGKYFLILFCITWMIGIGYSQEKEIFEEYQQLLPRGEIPAIINPDYVKANEAQISDSTWVLGVMISGHARAFSLNLLNNHEIVNDKIDTTSYAAVW
jgi:hypothetical protein